MNRWKLEARIKEKGYTLEQFSAIIGMERTTLWRRLTGATPFNLDEVNRVCDALDIVDPREYFFENRVAALQQLEK